MPQAGPAVANRAWWRRYNTEFGDGGKSRRSGVAFRTRFRYAFIRSRGGVAQLVRSAGLSLRRSRVSSLVVAVLSSVSCERGVACRGTSDGIAVD